jgi:KaiC/GvpD/RAD55 family RecA-like ATPase
MSRRTETATMYDLSAVLDVSDLEAVDPGTSILVSGPAMTGKEAFVLDALADGLDAGEGAIAVTTNGPSADVIEGLEDRVDDLDHASVGVIDCRAESNREEEETEAGAYVHHVGSPSDLTGIGIGITKSFERLHESGLDRGRVALTSLSTMLTYTDQQTVFKFCHVLSSRLDNAGFLGLFTMDSSAHDEQTLQVVKQAFDGMIEIREDGGVREARVMGIERDPSDWIEL